MQPQAPPAAPPSASSHRPELMWSGFEAIISPALSLDRHEQQRAAERLVLAADHVLYGLVLSGCGAALS